jgi:hypothetical protein
MLLTSDVRVVDGRTRTSAMGQSIWIPSIINNGQSPNTFRFLDFNSPRSKALEIMDAFAYYQTVGSAAKLKTRTGCTICKYRRVFSLLFSISIRHKVVIDWPCSLSNVEFARSNVTKQNHAAGAVKAPVGSVGMSWMVEVGASRLRTRIRYGTVSLFPTLWLMPLASDGLSSITANVRALR